MKTFAYVEGIDACAAAASIGLFLGLATAAYLFLIGQKDHRSPDGAARQRPLCVRLLYCFDNAAAAVARARVQLWKVAPSCSRPWITRLCGTRYPPACKVNRMFLLRHNNYSEKLRWTLELSGEDFSEVPVAIFAARPTAMYHSLGASDKLPIISTCEGHGNITSPAVLVEHLSKARWRAWMYPEGARELEGKIEKDLGHAAMRVAYAYLFQKGMQREILQTFSRGLPFWQRLLMPTLGAAVVLTMNEQYRFTEEISANMKSIRKTFSLVESILSDGRSYLCGDSISVADITFASLAFPVLLPDETSHIFLSYDPRTLPREYVEIIKSLRAREGGEFALRIYSQKRSRQSPMTPPRSPRRGRSFTLRKNVNSPSQSMFPGRADRRATITQPPNGPQTLVPNRPAQRRTTIVG